MSHEVIFDPDSPWSVTMIRGGLVALLGSWETYEDHSSYMVWHFKKDVRLTYYLASSLAGRKTVRFQYDIEHVTDVVCAWLEAGVKRKKRKKR